MDAYKLIKSTSAYKVFSGDKARGTLSHAYLIESEDPETLELYAKIFAKTLMCDFLGGCCNACRTCRLIDKKEFIDVRFYPAEGDKITVKDVDELVAKAGIKPVEGDKKLFVLLNAQDMTPQAQNKLLKTLEEPPANTYLILAASSLNGLLNTVLSRVKTLTIPPFSDELLSEAFAGEYDKEDVARALRTAAGKAGEVLKELGGEKSDAEDVAYSILTELNSSKEAYIYAAKINKEIALKTVTAVKKLLLSSLKYIETGKSEDEKAAKVAEVMAKNAMLFVLNGIGDVEKAIYFNGNVNAVADKLCFLTLEGKHKWQK